ncbi:hypothetical protein G6F35_015785 [Rhizopus arrhizus]|nr:hypothetical protein G6F35_015785 [Rhizopus arrhizus]
MGRECQQAGADGEVQQAQRVVVHQRPGRERQRDRQYQQLREQWPQGCDQWLGGKEHPEQVELGDAQADVAMGGESEMVAIGVHPQRNQHPVQQRHQQVQQQGDQQGLAAKEHGRKQLGGAAYPSADARDRIV